MTEGPDEVMWFGVDEGVLAYDGDQWDSYRSDDGLAGPILGVCTNLDGKVFAASATRIWELRSGSWEQLFPVQGEWQGGIYRLSASDDGALLVGTNFGFLQLVAGRITLYGPPECLDAQRARFREDELKALPAMNVAEDGMFPVYQILPMDSGNLLIRARDGIYECSLNPDSKSIESCTQTSAQTKNWFPLRSNCVCQASDGTVWGLGDVGIVTHLQADSTEQRWDLRELVNGDVTVSIAEGPHQTIWVGGQGTLFLYDGEDWVPHSQPDIPVGGAARVMLTPASDGTMWLASSQNDVYRVDYTSRRWLTFEDLNFGAETPDGTLWFFTKQGLVVSADSRLKQWQSYGSDEGMLDSPVTLFVTRQGRLWAAGSQGQEAAVAYFDGERWQRRAFPELSWGIDHRSVYQAQDDSLWFGGAVNRLTTKGQLGGVVRYRPELGDPDDDQAWQTIQLAGIRRSTYGIGQSEDGIIWFGGFGLSAYNPQTGKYLTDLQLPFPADAMIDDVHATPDHRLWLATRNYGLAAYDGSRWQMFDVSSGLPNNSVIEVCELSPNKVLVCTERGVSYYDGSSWIHNILPTEFKLGREGGDFRPASEKSLWINISSRGWKRRSLDQDIYDPNTQQFWTCRYVAGSQPPSTTVVHYEENVTERGNTTITWTGADRWHETTREELRYSHRFDGGDWSPYSATTQQVFTNIPSGEHSFEVRSRDTDLNIDPTPAKIRFRVAAPLWKRPWFLGLLSLTTVALLTSARSYSIRSRNQELVGLNRELQDQVELRELAEADLREKRANLRRMNAELEQRVAERTAALRDSNEQLEAFAHSVSHDLRAPLRAMEGFATALEEDYGNLLDDQGREFLELIMHSAGRLNQLITDLLKYSRLSRSTLTTQPVGLGVVVQKALEQLQAIVAKRNAQVEVAEELPKVEGQPAMLQQVIGNLVSNALKFVPESREPQIKIWAEEPKVGRIRLWIEDNGIGIEAAYRERIFKVFERLHSVEQYDGTGIGLAIVSRCCERLSGSCGVESTPGEGSRFWIELPAAEESSG